jgi:hypothetical protein
MALMEYLKDIQEKNKDVDVVWIEFVDATIGK